VLLLQQAIVAEIDVPTISRFVIRIAETYLSITLLTVEIKNFYALLEMEFIYISYPIYDLQSLNYSIYPLHSASVLKLI